MYKVIMVSPGGTKRDFQGGFDAAYKAEDFARQSGFEYCDENGFVWRLEVVDEEPETVDFIIPNKEWAEKFLELRENSDIDGLDYLCDIMENDFNRYNRLKYVAIRRLVDSLIPLNHVIYLMEMDEIPVNRAIEASYRNLMHELVEIAEKSQDIE